jgi:hypothetical protein
MLDFQLDDGLGLRCDAVMWHAIGRTSPARRAALRWLLCSVALLGPVFVLVVARL